MIRMKDIARQAGVSATTVSNVIHGKTGRVSPETVERINAILKELNYVPNISARMLANHSSGLIGVVLGYGKKGTAFVSEDPFVAAILGNLEYEIRSRGCHMMLVSCNDPQEVLRQAAGWNLDGIIALGMKGEDLEKIAKAHRRPVVSIDVYFDHPSDVVEIIMDDQGGAYQMGKYLIQKGHRKILFISDNDEGVDHYRWLGLRQALEEAGVGDCASRHLLIPRNPQEREIQYQALLPLFRQQTALFFSSDYYALEASNFLQNQGIAVPDELSIAGYDDVTYATLARPRLTTVHQMVDEKARRAVDAVLRLIHGEEMKKENRIPTYLVERESVRQI